MAFQKNSKIYFTLYYILVFLAISVGLYGLIYRLGFEWQWQYFNPNWEKPSIIPGSYIHFIFGPLWLIIGVFQFFSKLRNNNPKLHRYLGITYIVFCLLSNVGAWFLVWVSKYGYLQTGLPLTILNIVAIFTLVMAFYKIKFLKSYKEHQIWMIRNYACACSAITLRAMFIFDLFTSLEVSYTLQCWLAYPVALLISEIWIFKIHKQNQDKKQSSLLDQNENDQLSLQNQEKQV